MEFCLSVRVLATVLLLASSAYRGDGNNLQQSGDSETALNVTTFSGDGLADSLTLTCAAKSVAVSHLTPYSAAVTYTVKVFRFLYFPPLFIVGTFLNSLVIYLVARHKKLQILPFIIVLQVMVANILSAVALVLPIMVTTIADRWVLGVHVCVAAGVSLIFTSIVRTGIMFVFVVDRFLSVFFTFFYLRHKVKIAVSLSVFTWVFILLARLLTIPSILDCTAFLPSLNACTTVSSCNNLCSIYSSTFYVIIALPATVVPLFLYTALYCKAKLFQKNTARVVDVGGGSGARSVEERKRDHRVTITFLLLFVTLFVVTAPTVGTLIVLDQLYPSEMPAGAFLVQVVMGGGVSLLIVTDPIVIMRNKDVLEILSQMKARMVQKWCPQLNTCTSNH